MPTTKKPIDPRIVAGRILEMAEQMSKRITKVIHDARMELKRPAEPKEVLPAMPAQTARRPRRAGTRKAA
jgi:hypothetical protein